MVRKQLAQRGQYQNACYPNADDINLGCVPGEMLIYHRALRNTSRSGARSVAVYSSLNGEWYGRYESPDSWKRDHAFAGVCKTLYNLPGAPSTASARGSDYTTDSGIAYLESGSISASRNTGPEPIHPGDLVILDLPPTNNTLSGTGSFFLSPNNPNGGMPLGKYVMVTRPYHVEDQVGHLCTISALLRRSHTKEVEPGILGIPFTKAYAEVKGRPGNSILSDSSLEAVTCFHSVWGIWFALFEELVNSTNPKVTDALQAVLNASDETAKHEALVKLFTLLKVTDSDSEAVSNNHAINAFDYVLMQHNAMPSRRKAAMDKFKARNAEVLGKNTTSMRISVDPTSEWSMKQRYAFLTQSPLEKLYVSFAKSAAHTDAWIVGRALAYAGPGDTLDLLVACRTRPSNR